MSSTPPTSPQVSIDDDEDVVTQQKWLVCLLCSNGFSVPWWASTEVMQRAATVHYEVEHAMCIDTRLALKTRLSLEQLADPLGTILRDRLLLASVQPEHGPRVLVDAHSWCSDFSRLHGLVFYCALCAHGFADLAAVCEHSERRHAQLTGAERAHLEAHYRAVGHLCMDCGHVFPSAACLIQHVNHTGH
jgi:hypothetical protein